MNFIFFLIRSFFRILSYFFYILFEITIAWLLISECYAQDMPGVAKFLTVIFVPWIIIDIILKLVHGGGKSVARYIMSMFK